MPKAHTIDAAPPDAASWPERVEQTGLFALMATAAALQVSIAAAEALLSIAGLCWLALLLAGRERFEAPRFFWPLAVFAGLTLVSAAFSPSPAESFADSRQLLLLLVVPITCRLVSGTRGSTMITVIVTAGAASAALGIFQYGILRYDNLGMRPRGTLGHYMTYSGLLMLVICAALARLLFAPRDRIWAGLVMPALAVAVVVTFTRSAWIGACVAAALLLSLKDFRLLALLPIAGVVFFAVAPPQVTARFDSMFNISDPTNRDRLAMLRAGRDMIRDHPIVGVGPQMVEPTYAQYRDPAAVEPTTAHLHNVGVQIAAERGLPALAAWMAFVVVALVDLLREFRSSRYPMLAAAGLAAIAGMATAGLFEYNFGDSEFLMLFLLLITLPFGARHTAATDARA